MVLQQLRSVGVCWNGVGVDWRVLEWLEMVLEWLGVALEGVGVVSEQLGRCLLRLPLFSGIPQMSGLAPSASHGVPCLMVSYGHGKFHIVLATFYGN